MKPKWIALSLVFVSTFSHAATFVGPTTATNRLLVPSNAAIVITATLGNFTNSAALAQDGGSALPLPEFAPLQSGSAYAVAGPAELVFTNAALITYYQLTNSSIVTQGIANDPFAVQIPSNKTMHLFNVPAPVHMDFIKPGVGSAGFTLQPNEPAEFTGPGSLTLSSGVLPPEIAFISYFIAEDGFVLPNQRVLAGPSGSYTITVEKSTDLNLWSPVLLDNTTDDAQAFYRLRIQP